MSAIMPPTTSEKITKDGDSHLDRRRDSRLPDRVLLLEEAPPDVWHRIRGKMEHSGCEDLS